MFFYYDIFILVTTLIFHLRIKNAQKSPGDQDLGFTTICGCYHYGYRTAFLNFTDFFWNSANECAQYNTILIFTYQFIVDTFKFKSVDTSIK